ncbi:MAG TPA: STAS domain-containing protein [Acidimicrobiales bacterium]|jgi:anti-anti-sigma factor|nr:STAS domain-containing protein [Acidimicrobiales bacterium]
MTEEPTASVKSETAPDGTAVVSITGELDIATVDGIRQDLFLAVTRAGERPIVIDAGELSFMDSSGLAVLVWAAKQASSVTVAHASPTIRRIIELTGLETILHLQAPDEIG